jgi:hypothetical protein
VIVAVLLPASNVAIPDGSVPPSKSAPVSVADPGAGQRKGIGGGAAVTLQMLDCGGLEGDCLGCLVSNGEIAWIGDELGIVRRPVGRVGNACEDICPAPGQRSGISRIVRRKGQCSAIERQTCWQIGGIVNGRRVVAISGRVKVQCIQKSRRRGRSLIDGDLIACHGEVDVGSRGSSASIYFGKRNRRTIGCDGGTCTVGSGNREDRTNRGAGWNSDGNRAFIGFEAGAGDEAVVSKVECLARQIGQEHKGKTFAIGNRVRRVTDECDIIDLCHILIPLPHRWAIQPPIRNRSPEPAPSTQMFPDGCLSAGDDSGMTQTVAFR